MWKWAGLLVLAATGAKAEWVALDGDEIAAALIGPTFIYQDSAARQEFYGSGRTLYISGAPSWGVWRVEGDQYCSQWPPSARWSCYAVARDEAGAVRFSDRFGNGTVGVPAP